MRVTEFITEFITGFLAFIGFGVVMGVFLLTCLGIFHLFAAAVIAVIDWRHDSSEQKKPQEVA